MILGRAWRFWSRYDEGSARFAERVVIILFFNSTVAIIRGFKAPKLLQICFSRKSPSACASNRHLHSMIVGAREHYIVS